VVSTSFGSGSRRQNFTEMTVSASIPTGIPPSPDVAHRRNVTERP
jgi:hypothetical protein